MKIQTLIEGISSVLFHFTSFSGAYNIIKTNSLTSKMNQISFSRSIVGEYSSSYALIGVLFTIDGSKLANRFKGSPVGTENYDEEDGTKTVYRGRENRQYEDRIFTNKISNFSSYVKDCLIVLPIEYLEKQGEDEFEDSYIEQLNNLPDVVSILQKKFGEVKFVLSERDLANRRTYSVEHAKKRLANPELFWDVDYIMKVAPKFAKFIGMKAEPTMYQFFYEITYECQDEECNSDYESTNDPKLKGLDWDFAYANFEVEAQSVDELISIIRKTNDPNTIVKRASEVNDLRYVYKIELSEDITIRTKNEENYDKIKEKFVWYHPNL